MKKLLYANLGLHQPLARAVVHSLDGSLYQLSVQIGDQEHLVWASSDRPLRTRNILELKEKLVGLEIGELVLRQNSAYDEMVGQPDSGDNRLEVPLGREPYPFSDA
jgi:hypothetical protein